MLVLACRTAHASDLSVDVSARRARLMARLDPGSLLVLWSAPVQRYSLDINYEYRQDSNLYYLTGIVQDETFLILMPGNATAKEILFIKDADPTREQWEGHRFTRAEATATSGIATIRSTGEFDGFMQAMLSGRGGYGIDAQEAGAFLAARSRGRAALVLPIEGPDSGHGRDVTSRIAASSPSAATPALDDRSLAGRLVARARAETPAIAVTDALPLLAELRIIKTPLERRLLVQSLAVSSEAQRAGMRAAGPGAYEYTVKSAIEGAQRAAGAVSWSYPSIVASGPNATVIHYPGSSRQLMAGDLLLVDAAANVEYLSGDITRTYPVSGTFTSPQRALYEFVLDAQEAGIAVARRGGSLADIHDRTVEVIRAGLAALGLITNVDDGQYMMWFMHGATHYIGVDVHDVGDRTRPLAPGMAFVIEPGIYIDPAVLDRLPDSAATRALVTRIRPAVMTFAGLGIRIEDSFLVDDSGLVQLSSAVPRTIPEIEAFMRARPKPVEAVRRGAGPGRPSPATHTGALR